MSFVNSSAKTSGSTFSLIFRSVSIFSCSGKCNHSFPATHLVFRQFLRALSRGRCCPDEYRARRKTSPKSSTFSISLSTRLNEQTVVFFFQQLREFRADNARIIFFGQNVVLFRGENVFDRVCSSSSVRRSRRRQRSGGVSDGARRGNNSSRSEWRSASATFTRRFDRYERISVAVAARPETHLDEFVSLKFSSGKEFFRSEAILPIAFVKNVFEIPDQAVRLRQTVSVFAF